MELPTERQIVHSHRKEFVNTWLRLLLVKACFHTSDFCELRLAVLTCPTVNYCLNYCILLLLYQEGGILQIALTEKEGDSR